jgi:hypothetical protein
MRDENEEEFKSQQSRQVRVRVGLWAVEILIRLFANCEGILVAMRIILSIA